MRSTFGEKESTQKEEIHGRLYVIKLSGSLFFSRQFEAVTKTIRNVLVENQSLSLVLVAGGGANARRYIGAGSRLDFDQATLDELGIAVSRLNALVLAYALHPLSYTQIPKDLSELSELADMMEREPRKERVIVCGGLHPGQSTNAVAALIAEKLSADLFINATDVDGVYDKDPNKFSDATRFDSIDPEMLSRVLGEQSVQAGGYDLMDPVALKLISRSKVPTLITSCDPDTLSRILRLREKIGTTIVYDKKDGS